jgi:OFA family oxalate/formate antiporter-like MFS transporter
MNRRKAVAGSLLVQTGLGSIMSWSMLFTSARGRAGAILAPNFQSEWIMTAGLLAFAVAVLASAALIEKLGSQKIAIASGILLGAGYFSTLFLNISSLEQASLITGILGAAAGLVYIVSIDIGMKWYPEKKGIVTGFILAASGFGGLCWFRIQEIMVTWFSLQNTLLYIGFSSAILILAGSFGLLEPPAGYVPPVWKKPENPLADLPKAPEELKDILRRPAFYIIAASLILVSTAAIFFSGNLQYVCNKILTTRGLEVQLAARITLLGAAIFAISDSLGRIAWGAIADNIGFKLSIVILCAVETLLILIVSKLGGNGSVLIFGTFVIGTAFGGILTIFPCIVCDYIGEQEFFKTYSLIFALFLVNASVIILVSGFLKESFGANTAMWLNSLFFSGALPLAGGAVMLLLLKKSKRRAPEQEREMPNDVIPDEIKPDEMNSDVLTDENKEISREEDEAIQQNN